MTTRVLLCPILPLSLCSLCRLCPVLSSSPLLWLPLLQRRPRTIHRPPGGCCALRMNGGHGRSTSPAPAVDADHGNCVIGLTNSGPGMQWEWTGKSASLLRTQARAHLADTARRLRLQTGPRSTSSSGRAPRAPSAPMPVRFSSALFLSALADNAAPCAAYSLGCGRPPGRGAHRPQQQRPLGRRTGERPGPLLHLREISLASPADGHGWSRGEATLFVAVPLWPTV